MRKEMQTCAKLIWYFPSLLINEYAFFLFSYHQRDSMRIALNIDVSLLLSQLVFFIGLSTGDNSVSGKIRICPGLSTWLIQKLIKHRLMNEDSLKCIVQLQLLRFWRVAAVKLNKTIFCSFENTVGVVINKSREPIILKELYRSCGPYKQNFFDIDSRA